MEEGGRREGPGDGMLGRKPALLALRVEEGGPEPTEPPEAGKGLEMESFLELPGGMRSCQQLDVSPVRPVWDS